MIIVIAGTLIFSLLFLQSPSAGRKSERESDGFVGPAKKAVEEWSPVSGYSDPLILDSNLEYKSMTKMEGSFNIQSIQVFSVMTKTESTIHLIRRAIGPLALNLSRARIAHHRLRRR